MNPDYSTPEQRWPAHSQRDARADGSIVYSVASPSEYRQAGRGVDICYLIVPCPLGLVLVAGTPRGVCRVSFGHERKVLEEEIRSAFNKATFVKPDRNFASWVKKLVAHLNRPSGKLDLPLDIRCTVFQQTVWQALREIPAGKTSTYQEIAARIGRPTAARAVARACASNSIALAIPCHRAIGKNGALTGYRWGLERKRRLLENEGAISPEMKDPA